MSITRFRLSGAALALTLVLAGCGGGGIGGIFGGGGGGGLFASRGANLPLEELDAETIYQQAEYQLEQGNADDAAELFIEVERLHPYSAWAERALIMAAFSYHEDGDYEAARVAAQRYLDFYPGNEDAAYAQ